MSCNAPAPWPTCLRHQAGVLCLFISCSPSGGQLERPGAGRAEASSGGGPSRLQRDQGCNGSRAHRSAPGAAKPGTLIEVRMGRLSLSEAKSRAHFHTAGQGAETGFEPRSVGLRELWGEWLER